jgi:glucokinase
VRRRLVEPADEDCQDVDDLLGRAEGSPERLSTKIIAEAALAGNRLARRAFDRACRAYGWGIAQMVTLIAPEAVVVGGGVSLVADELLMRPLADYVDRYVFPPLAGTFQILRAELGEAMVVHGVLAMAAEAEAAGNGAR